MLWEQSDIEMSSWVAPNFVVPEGEGSCTYLFTSVRYREQHPHMIKDALSSRWLGA
jgi:hypothetical protein